MKFTALDAKLLTDAEVFVIRNACAGITEASINETLEQFAYEHIHIVHDITELQTLPDIQQHLSSDNHAFRGRLLTPLHSEATSTQGRAHTHHAETTFAGLHDEDLRALFERVWDLDANGVIACLKPPAHGTENIASQAQLRYRLAEPLGYNALHLLCCKPLLSTGSSKIRQGRLHVLIADVLLTGATASFVDRTTRSHSVRDGGWTPLMLAAYAGNTALVAYLLGKNANVHAVEREEGLTALHLAGLSL